MIDHQNSIIVIAARMAARHLPGKPLVDIEGKPLVVRVWHSLAASRIAPVLVAAAEAEIANAIIAEGGDAIVTGHAEQSPATRVAHALALRDAGRKYEYVVVVGDDILGLEAIDIQRCLAGLTNSGVEISTIAASAGAAAEPSADDPVVIAPLDDDRDAAYVRDMRRSVPEGTAGQAWHQINVAAFRRDALDRFAALPSTQEETSRGIELMRAVGHAMRLVVVRVDHLPLRVDTAARLDQARRMMKDKE